MNVRTGLEPSFVRIYEEPGAAPYVFLCGRCGRPLDGPHALRESALHAGSDGLGVGRAVRSSELARLAAASRAALGGWR